MSINITTLASSSRSVTLPLYARDGLRELIGQQFAKNYPLGGTLYVDYFARRGGWEIDFPEISVEEYDEIRALYDDQFANNEMLTLNDSELGITDMVVFLNMPPKRSLKWDKSITDDLTITLEPRDADS